MLLGCKMTNMSDEENAALVIKTGIEQLMRPFQDLLDKLLGPAATVIGESLGDQTKVWQFKRRIRFMREVQRLAGESGLKINPIATRLFFPAYEAASIEDDDDMQTRWAALIANEATTVGSVHPSFIEILRQLAPQDAQLLDKLYDNCIAKRTATATPWVGSVNIVERQRRMDAGENPEEAFYNLVRSGLVQATYKLVGGKKQLKFLGNHAQFVKDPELKEEYELSEVAFKFVLACRAPKPSEPSSSPHAKIIRKRR